MKSSERDEEMRGQGKIRSGGRGPRSALAEIDSMARGMAERGAVVFLDYDGTLTPIVDRPELATLSEEMRAVLKDLAASCPVAIVSGRDRRDVERLVGLDQLVYAGSHGFDIAGPGGLRMEPAQAAEFLPDLDSAEEELKGALRRVTGVLIERKRFSLAVHYRQVAETDVVSVEKTVRATLKARPRLARGEGKRVFEIRPGIDWDKGKAVTWLLEEALPESRDALPFYLGDDVTDEDAFRALEHRGVGIRVGDPSHPTRARYFLRDPEEVGSFLRELARRLEMVK